MRRGEKGSKFLLIVSLIVDVFSNQIVLVFEEIFQIVLVLGPHHALLPLDPLIAHDVWSVLLP